jgi:AcrR family transcriptional regulator
MGESKSWQAGPLRIRVSMTGRGEGAERAKERLTVARIVDTALALMRKEGYDAVSMRAIAKALDTGPASLYAHVESKDHLDQLVIGRIAEQVRLPEPDAARWEVQVKEMMTDALRLYREYPGSARAAMAIIPTEEGSLRSAEGLLGLFRAGGIPSQVAAWGADMISLYVGATAVEESIWAERAKTWAASGDPAEIQEKIGQVHDFYADLPTDRFPLVAALADEMTAGAGDERFEFGLAVIIEGMKALAGQASR